MAEPRDDSHARPSSRDGDASTPSAGDLFRAHYHELRQLAGRLMRGERAGHTLQGTALVHEAFLRVVDRARVASSGDAFFKASIAQECRRLLVDHARSRDADRRGGKLDKHSLEEVDRRLGVHGDVDILELHDTIEELYARNESIARVVDLRVFGGLSIAETAEALGVSPRTINKHWAFAQSWLRRELAR